MKPPVPAPALRAARALLKKSQLDFSKHEQVRMNVKSLRAAEKGTGTEVLVQRLRGAYEAEQIEFLGSIDIGSGDVIGAGVRWLAPPSSLQTSQGEHVSVEYEFAFSAARAFLDLTLQEVSDSTEINIRAITELETHSSGSDQHRQILRDFYHSRGVRFLGWRDPSTNRYYGVGVQADENGKRLVSKKTR